MGKCTFILHHFISFCKNCCSLAVISDSLWSHGLQHARLPCPSPRVCSNPCPLSQWSYLTISSSAAPFPFGLSPFPASRSFPLHGSQLCAGKRACVIQWSYEPSHTGLPKTNGSQWRVLTKHGSLEEGMAIHSTILATKTSWTGWIGNSITGLF